MPSTTSRRFLRPAALIGAAVLAASVTACGSSGTPSAATPTSASASASADAAAGVLTVRDPWVKAADKGMTAAFGTLVNDGDADVTITKAATEVSPMELHEMTMKDGKMVMQAKDGGIVIKARSSTTLEPGGDHLMLMNLAKPVKAGDELSFTLTFADGRTQTFTAVAKPFTGAQESYAPGHGDSPMPEMSMSPAS
ncbi:MULTISPECIES: copper chaperone PCu(A)C [unclassified Micromonospora]|uniref:copper chaperone PCu(A)C n=1 Tax=unclassified Micromonospora TaxID=2617518 RepID=UPI001C23CDAE|nr:MULTISPECIES: copper chaperone PCu(A)C [unclassified Micromonospora]MBU8861368.1 copper chaperone PCu(A)C [Micromonospora sp. WMMB482]MDM4780926.1 copper chaperone PCu(A)C [Micromonospora sp. b486]